MALKNKWRWVFIIAIIACLADPYVVLGSEAPERFVDFSLEDTQDAKYSQSCLKDKITLVVLQSRTTLQAAIDCKTELIKLINENQKAQMIAIMDLRQRPALVPKFAVKKKILSQDPTSKEIPFLLDWDGEVTKAIGGSDSKCMVLIVDHALNVVYKQEYKWEGIDSEIKPLLADLSDRQK